MEIVSGNFNSVSVHYVAPPSSLLNSLFNNLSNYILNDRQLNVMKKLIEHYPGGFEGGLTNRKYVSITKTSSETAKRDIKKLLDMGLLSKNSGKGRSTNYSLNETALK